MGLDLGQVDQIIAFQHMGGKRGPVPTGQLNSSSPAEFHDLSAQRPQSRQSADPAQHRTGRAKGRRIAHQYPCPMINEPSADGLNYPRIGARQQAIAGGDQVRFENNAGRSTTVGGKGRCQQTINSQLKFRRVISVQGQQGNTAINALHSSKKTGLIRLEPSRKRREEMKIG
jgi:hypothetical protein